VNELRRGAGLEQWRRQAALTAFVLQGYQVPWIMGTAVIQRGDLIADARRFGDPKLGVKVERTEPVMARQGNVARCLQGAAEAIVRASLLVGIADLAGQGQGGGVLGTSLVRPPGRQHDRADAVERLGLANLVTTLADQGQGSLVAGDGLLTWARRTPQLLSEQQQVTTSPPVRPPYLTYSSATDAPAVFGQSGQAFGISGAGADLYSGADAYSTIYQEGAVASTATITTEVTSQQDMTGFAKAGHVPDLPRRRLAR
jgi:hypothetical protein